MGAWRLLHEAVPAASLASWRQRISCENFDSAELVSSIDTATATVGNVRGVCMSAPRARREPIGAFAHAQSRPMLLQSDKSYPRERHLAHAP